jgi:LmbE family N-acetylglucosaminyl deacetylase
MNRKLIQTVVAILVASVLLTAPRAQQTTAPAPAEDRVALYQALLDLTNPWTVMCIAAHPDDEDGTSLIVMRRKFGAHTVSLFSTFGEGGQNAIGPELYEEMGAIRARETKAAAEIQGSEPHFLGLKDFGFSKSADEAFRFWGHEEALRRMVLEIRKLRPDVIITNHSVTNNDHGHHQATARLELEAFDAAADPARFPEQLKDGVTVWLVQRLFVRARGNQNQTDNAPLVTIDPNEKDPVRGISFAEQALSALQKHATQGPWPKTVAQMASRFTNSADGRLPLTRYRLAREAKGAAPVPSDSHNFVDGLSLPVGLAALVAPPAINGKRLTDAMDQRKLLIHTLADMKSKIGQYLADNGGPTRAVGGYRLAYQSWRVNSALLAIAGITASLSAKEVLIPGERTSFSFTISNRGPEAVPLLRLSPPTMPLDPNAGLLQCCPKEFSNHIIRPGESLAIPLSFSTPTGTGLTVPHAEHLYDNRVFGFPTVTYTFARVGETEVTIPAFSDPDVSPAVGIDEISPSPLVLTQNTPANARSLAVMVTNHQSSTANGRLALSANASPIIQFQNGPSFSLAAHETKKVDLPVGNVLDLPKKGEPAAPLTTGTIPLSILVLSGASKSSSLTRSVQAVVTDARVQPNLRVGYVRGFDFSLPNALNALGVESKELSVDEVKTADLQKYTSIIVDNRVYESTPGLIAVNQKLLDYAKAGGTLIVFYHKTNEWNPDERRNRPQLAPYKLILGDERITDETAPITFLEPQHPLLNSPNKMGQEDFAGWIQERGLYYPKEWDPQYQALLQSNDPGEAPLKGGLLVADYGSGKYIYTSMVWYRELRAGMPGAYRMLANMISYGRAK